MSAPAQITICGVLNKEAIAQLVDIALAAGAGLIVPPRAIVATSADVPRRALPPAPASMKRTIRCTIATRVSPVDDRRPTDAAVRTFLGKHGPCLPRDFAEEFDLTAIVGRQILAELASRGVVELVGVTTGRRVRLPGQRPKEAP